MLLWLLASFLLIYPNSLYGELFTQEDGLIESIGAFGFFLASCCFFYCFLLERPRKNKAGPNNYSKYYYILLCLLFLFAFGEEISWGQRIFGWSTPEDYAKINQQGETNLHNLSIFKGRDRGNFDMWSIFKVLTIGRLFNYFWMLYLLVIPILNYLSPRAEKLFASLSLPIAPIWIGGLMLTNLIIAGVWEYSTSELYYDSITEIKETNYALIILVWGWTSVQSLMPTKSYDKFLLRRRK